MKRRFVRRVKRISSEVPNPKVLKSKELFSFKTKTSCIPVLDLNCASRLDHQSHVAKEAAA